MVDVQPFSGIRPRDDIAHQVIAPPYDVLTLEEAQALAKNEKSFVHITRSEVDLPAGTDAHSEAAYLKARDNLDQMLSDGTLMQDDEPTYYFYGQKMGEHRQVGIIAACSVAEYDKNIIKKHEYTRPDKEDDRTEHMDIINRQVGLVFLAYRAHRGLRALTKTITSEEPCWSVTTEDGVEHTLWKTPPGRVQDVRRAFDELPALYIADGHHRSAAASRVHARRMDDRSAYFLAGLFPDDELQVLAYNRVVHDLNGLDRDAFMAAVDERFHRSQGVPVPAHVRDISMYIGGEWWTIRPRAGQVVEQDPVAALDVSALQDLLLAPVLGIDNPRTSTRIDFVGGIRGPDALVDAVDNQGKAVAFHMYPTPLEQLFLVADKDKVMPPKSTWFEPKLREGVVIRSLV